MNFNNPVFRKGIAWVLLLSLGTPLRGGAQVMPDSVWINYRAAKTYPARAAALNPYFSSVATSKNSLAQRVAELSGLKEIFLRKSDQAGADHTAMVIAGVYRLNSEYSIALANVMPTLQNFEERKDTLSWIRALILIGSCFKNSDNPDRAIFYDLRGEQLADIYGNAYLHSTILNNLADCYNELNKPDSALPYIQQAITLISQMSETQRNTMPGTMYATMGQTYLKLGELDLAQVYLRKSIVISLMIRERRATSNAENSLSQVFFAGHYYDSALVHARIALDYALPELKTQAMQAYQRLYEIFEKTAQADSVNKYFRLATTMKDSVFTNEKTRNIQAMDFQEQLRQEEQRSRSAAQAEERSRNIQFALIALGIILLVGLFLLLSRSFITNARVIDLFGIIALLMVFEFLNLLLHPFLERITHHSPILMLLALVALAAILAPIHHRLEKWTTRRLIQKNRDIRLAKAKKTIEKLEKRS